MDRRDGIRFVDHRSPGPHEGRADGRVGLFRERRDVANGDLPGRGACHQQHRRGAPVALDAEVGGAVVLASRDVELLVVALVDLDAEAFGRVERHVQIGGRDGVADVQRGVTFGPRQREQQPRDELRRDRTVDFDLSAVDRSAHLDGQESAVVAHRDAQLPQRVEHHRHRALEQRPAAFDGDGRRAERGHGGEQACREARFPDVEAVAPGVQSPLDRERRGVDLFDPGAERLDAAQRRTGVVAELQIAQHRGLFREQGCRQGTLCITFRAGRRQRTFDAARWNRFVHIYPNLNLTFLGGLLSPGTPPPFFPGPQLFLSPCLLLSPPLSSSLLLSPPVSSCLLCPPPVRGPGYSWPSSAAWRISSPRRFFISWVSWWLFLSSKCCPR